MYLNSLIVCLLLAAATACAAELASHFQPKQSSRQREAIEWSITYAYNATDREHPRVLLIGDSICNGYQRKVRELLQNEMNVSFWATSKCVTDPDYFRELEFILGAYQYDVISFNNGLHSLTTVQREWDEAFKQAVRMIKAKCPRAKLLICNSTPLRDGEQRRARVVEINRSAQRIAEAENLPVIDLYGLMEPLDRKANWGDVYHFRPAAIELQACKMAEAVRGCVEKKETTPLRQHGTETGPDGREK